MVEEGKVSKVKTLFVSDSNQQGDKARVHQVPIATHPETKEVLAVHDYSLFSNPTQAVEMPEDHAMFFTKDSAFIVMDHDGNRIEPVVVKDVGVGRIILDENELVAQYEELTQDALYKRCKVVAGSSDISKKTPKKDMITFLKQVSGAVGVSRGSEAVISEMDGVENLLDVKPQAALSSSALSQVMLHN